MIQNRESSHNKTSKSKLLVYTSNFSLEFALDFVNCQSNILSESRLKGNMILPTLKISHSQYFSWHLSASQATIPAGGADTAGARAWLLIGRCGAWGWSQLSALSSWLQNASVCEKLYQSWEAWPSGLLEQRGSSGCAGEVKGSCYQPGWLRWCCCAVGTRVTTAQLWLRGSVISLRKCC